MIWDLDPVAISFGGLAVRWYGLGYVASFFLVQSVGWRLLQKLNEKISRQKWDDLTFGLFLWGIIGGRLGEFIFFSPDVLFSDPLEVLKIWHGGMSIHGGFIGATLFAWWFTRKHQLSLLTISDVVALPLSLGLMIGRITNYINGELVGIPTDKSWGVIFPHVDQLLRYPTQLYEAGTMLLLAGILGLLWSQGQQKIRGFLSANFLIGYGLLRFIVEIYKDVPQVLFNLTMGQVLCAIMLGVGLFLITTKCRKTS